MNGGLFILCACNNFGESSDTFRAPTARKKNTRTQGDTSSNSFTSSSSSSFLYFFAPDPIQLSSDYQKSAMNNEAPIIVKTTEEMETELPSATFIKERRILVPIDISSYHHSKVSTEFVLKHLIKPKESIIHFLTIIPRKEVSVYSSQWSVAERLALQSS